jgi:CDP-paratose synthetase
VLKILLTGATGFIGTNLVKKLALNHDVVILARAISENSFIDRVNTYKYSNYNEILPLFKREKFDGVIHLASLFLSEHTNGDIQSLIESNITFGTTLLEASKQSGVKWFINSGTYWQNYQNKPYNPVNLYASTKEAFENIAKYYVETSSLIFTTLKLFDTFGKNDSRKKILTLWEESAKSGTTLEMSAGEQKIDINYIDDVINAYIKTVKGLSSSNAQEYNLKSYRVSSGNILTLKELATIYQDATNSKLNIVWGAKNYREREIMMPCSIGDILPNWQPQHLLKDAIREVYGTK